MGDELGFYVYLTVYQTFGHNVIIMASPVPLSSVVCFGTDGSKVSGSGKMACDLGWVLTSMVWMLFRGMTDYHDGRLFDIDRCSLV